MRKSNVFIIVLSLIFTALPLVFAQTPPQPRQEQRADESFDTKVDKPAYKKNGPKVLFDEAHNNFHTTSGRYKPFADLMTHDGYQITPNKEKFSAAVLKAYRVLVISNAQGAPRTEPFEAWSNPAFTAAECDAVRDWVKAGGSLFLIADHEPNGSANQILGSRFDIDMSKSYTIDDQNCDKETNNGAFIIYTRESGRLADHAVTRGRNTSEQVNRIIAFTGQSLKGPPASIPFLKLADSAQNTMPPYGSNPFVSAAGRAQGIALKFGKGRAIFLGEAAMMSAQVTPQGMLFGMNRSGIDNRQLALNIMHWLSGLLN
ncbi:MAG TPA: hypothetical protein VN643_08315 [Pyrinomonadaceae bacterium]|nr:hypothetical protein [Pyrinomonadaceae bacterium]